jgi:hypothetical protein
MNQYTEIAGIWLCLASSYQVSTQKFDPNLILVFWMFWFAWISFPRFKEHLNNILSRNKKGEDDGSNNH